MRPAGPMVPDFSRQDDDDRGAPARSAARRNPSLALELGISRMVDRLGRLLRKVARHRPFRTSSRGAPLALPAFNEDGDLPPGVHPATLSEILDRLRCRIGPTSCRDRSFESYLSARFLDRATGAFRVFGSFVTAKAEPNDVDIVLLMEDRFDLASVTGEAALVFQHMEADAHFGASMFWTRRSGAIGGEQAMIEYWQVRREGGQRGIVEIVPEGS